MDPKVLGPILAKHELALVSGWFSGELLSRPLEEEQARMAGQMATFRALGAPVMVYAETTGSVQSRTDLGVTKRPRLPASEFAAYGRKLTQLAEWMTGQGVPMAYHHHMGTIVENQREIDLLMANTGAAVGLLLDTGHLVYAGADVAETARRHGQRINHVHCKDIRAEVLKRARQRDQSFLGAIVEGVFTVPGDGSIDYYALARLLFEMGYEGWVVVEAEQDPAKAPPGAYSAMGRRHLAEAFGAAGFKIMERAA